jgi:hypothetical protein
MVEYMDIPGQYNVTYVEANGNGSVSIMWDVVTCRPMMWTVMEILIQQI